MRNSSGPRFDSVLVHVKKMMQAHLAPAFGVVAAVVTLSACGVFDPAGQHSASPSASAASPMASSSSMAGIPPTASAPVKVKLPAKKLPAKKAKTTLTAPRAAAPCTRADLAVSIGAGSSTAGALFQQIVFSNKSKAACTLAGFPGAALTSAQSPASQLGDAAGRNPVAAHTVTLRPGQAAASLLRITNPANFPQDQGHTVTSAFLQVYLPAPGAPVYVPDAVQATTVTSVPLLLVSPAIG